MRIFTFAFGVFSYLVFLVSFLYAIGFVGDLVVPKTINSGVEGPAAQAVLINLLLLGLFAVQHSVMARPAFKKWWTQIVPRSLERSIFVLLASLVLLLLFWQWRPITGVVWSIEHESGRFLMHALFGMGWLIVLLSTFMINHFDLFGLRQVWLKLRQMDYRPLPFQKVALYRFVRHPIMLGFLIAFWATPEMTQGHLLFALATTGYIFMGIFLEERDLRAAFGRQYEKYRSQVPMLLPLPRRDDQAVGTASQQSQGD